MAAQPALVLAVARAALADEAPEALRVIQHLEVGDLVLHHVVHDLLRRQQQAPVEAHRAVRGAAGPARALRAHRQALVARARAGARRAESRRDLLPRALAVPRLERVAQRLPTGLAELHVQHAAGPQGYVRALPPGLDLHAQHELAPHVRDGAAVLEPDARVLLGRPDPPERPLDPGALLLHERLDVLERHPLRDHDLHPVGIHDDPRVAGAVGAADGVRDAVLGLGHGRATIGA